MIATATRCAMIDVIEKLLNVRKTVHATRTVPMAARVAGKRWTAPSSDHMVKLKSSRVSTGVPMSSHQESPSPILTAKFCGVMSCRIVSAIVVCWKIHVPSDAKVKNGALTSVIDNVYVVNAIVRATPTVSTDAPVRSGLSMISVQT